MVTTDLQNMNADWELAIRVIKYLRHFSSLIPALSSPILSVLSKWVAGNSINTYKWALGSWYNLLQAVI